VQNKKRKTKMKKIMIAAAIVCAAVMAQAATVSWGNGFGINAYNQPGDEGAAYSGTIYLMNGDATAAASFINTVLAATDYTAAFNTAVGSSVASMTHAGFEPAAKGFETTLTGAQSFYVVALDAANSGVYVSEVVDANIMAIGESDVRFTHDAPYENGAFASTQTSYAGSGWYTAVPEPTSGLLMLVGLAGLALRRRRA
jgi:hypothetical protein